MSYDPYGSILKRNERRRAFDDRGSLTGEHYQRVPRTLFLCGLMLLMGAAFAWSAYQVLHGPPPDLTKISRPLSRWFAQLPREAQAGVFLFGGLVISSLSLTNIWLLIFRRAVLILSEDGIEFGRRSSAKRRFISWKDMKGIWVRSGAVVISGLDDRTIPYFACGLSTREFLEEVERHRPDLVHDLLKKYR